jgi:hypothetical protein
MKKALLLLLPVLLAGCLYESAECVGDECANASINASLDLPAKNESYLPSFNYSDDALFDLQSDYDSVRLGESFKFNSHLSFSKKSAYATVSALKDGETTGTINVSNNGEPLEFEYEFAGKKTGEYEVAFTAEFFDEENSPLEKITDSFTVTVKQLKHYREEKLNSSTQKAAQSFALEFPVKISRVTVYGEGEPILKLCTGDAGKPVESSCFTNNASSKGFEHSIEVEAALPAGKHWVVAENFSWFTDLYGEYESNALDYDGSRWLPSERNYFFEATN